MTEMNIKEFIAATREHLFGLITAPQPALATTPVCQGR